MKIMKHLMRYEGYTTAQRVDDILDKISKHGIKSLSNLEKDFLDAHKYGGEENVHQELNKIESERFFEDDSGLFKFEFDHIEYHNNEKHYYDTHLYNDHNEKRSMILDLLDSVTLQFPNPGPAECAERFNKKIGAVLSEHTIKTP